MEPDRPMISLGFTDQRFPAGVHICQIFSEREEQLPAMLRYMREGLVGGEQAACACLEAPDEGQIVRHFSEVGVNPDEVRRTGAFSSRISKELYLPDGQFDPDRVLEALEGLYRESQEEGYKAMRVMGELAPEIEVAPGGSRLPEYEARVNLLVRDRLLTTVCQYDANRFSGAMLMKILKVHPYMVVRGSVVHNPFYVPPEEYLAAQA